MINNPLPPPIHPIRAIDLPPLEHTRLSNGLPCYQVNMGTQDLVRIEAVFWAGRPYEREKLVARTTTSLIKEGTLRTTGAAIAEHFDYYGAGLSTPFQLDTGNVAMYCLSKHVPEILPLFMELLTEPAFAPGDLQAYIKRKQSSLKEDLSKPEVLAYRQITECFFGAEHPYGYNSNADTYAALQAEWLHEHHRRCFHANNGFVLISGRVDQATEAYIYQQLAQLPARAEVPAPRLLLTAATPAELRIAQPGAVQAAIRMGRRLFSRNHLDANGMYVLATLLGGYFGSRLMENIREDKGYTYNISASYDSMRFDGAFHIETEVSPDFLEPTLREIRLEMARLQNEPIPADELEMVRNYLMGSFLTMIDGPFNWAETVRTLLVEQLDTTALQRLVETVQTITAEQLQDLAQRYFNPQDNWTVLVGH